MICNIIKNVKFQSYQLQTYQINNNSNQMQSNQLSCKQINWVALRKHSGLNQTKPNQTKSALNQISHQQTNQFYYQPSTNQPILLSARS